MLPKNRPPAHPGEVLFEEFLKPLGMTPVQLAERLGVPSQRINGIVNGRRAVNAETAVLLAREIGTTAQFWMNLQTNYDLWHAQKRLGAA